MANSERTGLSTYDEGYASGHARLERGGSDCLTVEAARGQIDAVREWLELAEERMLRMKDDNAREQRPDAVVSDALFDFHLDGAGSHVGNVDGSRLAAELGTRTMPERLGVRSEGTGEVSTYVFTHSTGYCGGEFTALEYATPTGSSRLYVVCER